MVGQSTPNCQNGCQLYNWTPSPHFPLIRTSEILSIHTLFPMAKVPMLMPFLEDQLPATSCHSILVFVVPVILSFLALKYLGQNTSPFKTHPKTMGFSIGCLLVYCLAYGAQQKFSSALHQPPTYANAWGRCMEWFGSMLLASLASICFPDSVQWMFFVFYAILCMGGPLFTLLQMLWKWIHPTPTVAPGHLHLGAVQPREGVPLETSGGNRGITIPVN